MIWRLRDALGGGTRIQAADAAVGRGLADLLAALDDVIDDDAALASVCAGLGRSVPGAVPDRGAATAADQVCARTGRPGSAITTARTIGPAASRRLAVGAVTGVAAVLTAGAVAWAAAGVPGVSRGSAAAPAHPAAYVVKRVDSALTAADPGEIAQMTVTIAGAVSGGQGAATTAEEWSYGDQWRTVTYSPAGQQLYDEVSTGSVYTVISYPARTWARQSWQGQGPAPLSGPRSCGPVLGVLPLLFVPGVPGGGALGSSPETVARDLRAAISCGSLTVAGSQRVNGIDATELASRPGSTVTETVWVSPGTYLPVRVVIRPAPGQSGRPSQTANIAWLPPAPQNLALLTAPVPAGFSQVPFAQAVAPIMQHYRTRTG
jgi:hypothetical protein